MLLVLISMGEARLFQRLLFVDPEQYGFVLAGVEGVLNGRPVSKSWQQRWLAPSLLVALDPLSGDRFRSLQWFASLLLGAANVAVFVLARRRGNRSMGALTIAAGFGFVHLLLAFRLEYPWDAIDILLMLGFGAAAARDVPLAKLWPLLLVGLFNHETILYVPLYYLLQACGWPPRRTELRAAALACGCLLALCGAIYLLREQFYLGQPLMPGQVFETPLPMVENHLHIKHNLQQWFWGDFRDGRSFISLSLSAACAACVIELWTGTRRVAATWTLLVIASIVCFGYVNETRHYLVLVAFWFGYACPKLQIEAGRAA